MCKQVISHRLMAAKGDDSTNHSNTLQTVLDYIENNIRNELTAGMIAEKAGYSVYHFSRVFKQDIGISVMSYVTWRRLQHALYDLTQGKKIIDAAMEYGFETHAGFTKAFVHWFGFPPSLCRLRLTAKPPMKPDVKMLTHKFFGGNAMIPHIIELSPFYAVGYPTRHKLESMKGNVNASTFWEEANVNFSELTRLHNTFTKSKHFEICMCYDMDESAREFSYVVACGIDRPEDLERIEPDMTKIEIEGGLYAIFSTPPADESFTDAAQETWNEIFLHWLPQSEFEYDESRPDFSYHDYRDHGWYFGGKLQVDICIPIRQREEETMKAQLRGF
jgi:AraC family transcriptional regulator